MEVEVHITSMDFDFNSARPSPCPTAPSSPKRFGEYYFSAPTSPTHLSQFYRDFDDFYVTVNSPASIPFSREEKPGTPQSLKKKNEDDEDYDDDNFAFSVNEETEKSSVTADELFDGGKIRPLKPPPQLQLSSRGADSETWKSKKNIFYGAFSPRRKKETDPVEAAVEGTNRRTEQGRGRERSPVSLSYSNSGRRAARSLSPLRVSKYPWEEEQQSQQQQQQNQPPPNAPQSNSIIPKPTPCPSSSSSLSSRSKQKWRLKDFFLFRSASEGRAADRDPLRKYTALFRRHEDGKNSSFRSMEGSNSGGSRRRGPPVSPHELHYTANRAVSQDMKKKTFLPYKQGILGRLAFNPAVHALANGFGFSRK